MAEHSPSFQNHRRNTTVVVAVWVLGLIALLEVILACLALAPRILTAIRTTSVNSALAATSSPAPQTSSIQAPATKPLENSPVKTFLSQVSQGDHASAPAYQPSAAETSLQGGNSLGIVNVKLDGSDDAPKKLVIAMKARPKEVVDVPQIRVQVFFYDEDGGEVIPSKAQSVSKWLSSGTDWKDGEPELLEVRYLPDTADSGVKFAGYVVAVYYKGDLQDYRAEPSRLTKLFPLKYFIGLDES